MHSLACVALHNFIAKKDMRGEGYEKEEDMVALLEDEVELDCKKLMSTINEVKRPDSEVAEYATAALFSTKCRKVVSMTREPDHTGRLHGRGRHW